MIVFQGQQLFYFSSSSGSAEALGSIQLQGARMSAVAVPSSGAAGRVDHHQIELAPDPTLLRPGQYKLYRLAASSVELQVRNNQQRAVQHCSSGGGASAVPALHGLAPLWL